MEIILLLHRVTAFSILILTRPCEMQSGQENTGAPSTALSRLMGVDDEADITFTLKKVLEQSGLVLDVFNDPTKALVIPSVIIIIYGILLVGPLLAPGNLYLLLFFAFFIPLGAILFLLKKLHIHDQ